MDQGMAFRRRVLIAVRDLVPTRPIPWVDHDMILRRLQESTPDASLQHVLDAIAYAWDMDWLTCLTPTGGRTLRDGAMCRLTGQGRRELERPEAEFGMPFTANTSAFTFAGNANIGQLSTGSHSTQEITLNITVGQVLEALEREIEQKVSDPEKKRSFLAFLAELKVIPDMLPFLQSGVQEIGKLTGGGLA